MTRFDSRRHETEMLQSANKSNGFRMKWKSYETDLALWCAYDRFCQKARDSEGNARGFENRVWMV
jgi:hypothetical protein